MSLSRRTVLRGLGTAVALPWLEAFAGEKQAALGSGGGQAPALQGRRGLTAPAPLRPPLRAAFVYAPNGATMTDFTPATEGAEFELPFILEPLADVRSDILVLSGLAHHEADVKEDGGGDHARASATFLTGARARKTAAVDIRAGVSVDQVAAKVLGKLTRIPSLELTCDRGQQAGSCDSGYNCAYQFCMAWKDETLPLPPEVDPRAVFERLFSDGPAGESASARRRRRAAEHSVLDFVLGDMRSLRPRVGTSDRRKLDEYFTAVRDIEEQLARAERFPVRTPDAQPPTAIPRDYAQHMRVMFDLMALAFQTDTTRLATFMLAHDGSNRAYPMIGVPEGHHDISHHGGSAAKKASLAKINRYHATQFAYFVERLRGIRDGEGSLLDSCMVVYGSAIADGNTHTHFDLPVLLAGRGGGTIAPGRHVRYDKDTPMANLYLALLERLGVKADRLGDSTGVLDGLGV